MFKAERIAGPDFEPGHLVEFLRPSFRKFEFSTPMSTAHAVRLLEEIVEPPRKWGWPTSTKRGYFEGRVAGSRFKILRIVHYQNSFRPIIEGREYFADQFSLGDISFIPPLANLERAGYSIADGFPNLKLWWARMKARPSFNQSWPD